MVEEEGVVEEEGKVEEENVIVSILKMLVRLNDL